MTTFLLIRHAHVDAVGNLLAGRQSGHRLSPQGHREADRLADWLSEERIDRIYSSPLERALETAAALARNRDIQVQSAEALHEFHFGEWSGRSFADLQKDPLWQTFNTVRSSVRPPGGETMLEVQARAVAFLQRLAQETPHGTFAMVTHCDVIRAMLCDFLGMPVDLFHRMEIHPASVSRVHLESAGPIILGLNLTPSESLLGENSFV